MCQTWISISILVRVLYTTLYPYQLTPQVLCLDLKHFNLDSARTTFGPVRSVVLPMAMGDGASLLAVSTYAALDGSPPRHEEAARLKGQTICLVNAQLPEITEHLLYTVTFLWMIEVGTARFEFSLH